MRFNKSYQNSRQNLSKNELRRLFEANKGEAFSYPSSITRCCLSYAEFLSYFTLYQIVYAGVLHNYTKIMLLDSEYLKTYPHF